MKPASNPRRFNLILVVDTLFSRMQTHRDKRERFIYITAQEYLEACAAAEARRRLQ